MPATLFDHIHIYASDVEASLGFYERFFQAERLGVVENADGERNHLVMLGGQVVAVSRYPPGTTPGPLTYLAEGVAGVAHVGLNVTDLEACVAALTRAGVKVIAAPKRAPFLRYCYVAAPDGVVVELTQYDVAPRLRPLVPLFHAYNWLSQTIRKGFVKAALPKA